jgi:hypothetical protein
MKHIKSGWKSWAVSWLTVMVVCLFVGISSALADVTHTGGKVKANDSKPVSAEGKMPDLLPLVVDADQGVAEIKNIGDAASEPGKVFVVCSRIYPGSIGSEPCAAGSHIPGFIEKWNTLPFDVPALKPGASFRFKVFGAGAFERRFGAYVMNIAADPQKRIVEANEKNNLARLELFPKPGILRLLVQDDLPQLPFHYSIRWQGKSAGKSRPITGTRPIRALPLDLHLAPGPYDVRVVQHRSNYSSGDPGKMLIGEFVLANRSEVLIKSKDIVEVKLVFRQEPPGKLKLHLIADGHPIGAWTGIGVLEDDESQPELMRRNLEADTELKLLPGRYVVSASPKDEGPYSRKHGYGTQQASFEILSGQTTEKTLRFVSARRGKLILTALVDGGRSKADIKVRPADSKETFGYVDTSYNLSSNSVELVPGHYDISVLPLEYTLSLGAIDTFHGGVEGPGIKTKSIRGIAPVILKNIEIEPGDTLERTVEFKTK